MVFVSPKGLNGFQICFEIRNIAIASVHLALHEFCHLLLEIVLRNAREAITALLKARQEVKVVKISKIILGLK